MELFENCLKRNLIEPFFNFENVGHYFLAEARHHHNKMAQIYTDDLPGGTTCVSFSYFIYGSGVKTFKIKAIGSRVNHVFKTLTGSQSNQWKTLHYSLGVPVTWKVSIHD